MKKLFAVALLSMSAYTVNAQNVGDMTGSAYQSIELSLSNVLEISFSGNNNTVGPNVSLAFNNINDYVNGIESNEQELKIRSNKKFKVDVKSDAPNFTYSGPVAPAPVMAVENVLGLKIITNNTGGSYDGVFNTSNFQSIRDNNQLLLNNCNPGSDKRFSVKYYANPGLEYPGGNYTINVVYTATQM